MAGLPHSRSGKSAEEVARTCAREAARILMDRYPGRTGGRGETQKKGRGNFVTETDLACERAVLGILKEEYPDHPVLSEETAAEKRADWDRGWLWVVDPIDGTHNYSQGIPHFCFTIALCHDGEPVLGLTHAPVADDEFFAVKGGGLRVNGSPVSVVDTPSLEDSVWGMDLGYHDARGARLISLLSDVWPGIQAVRVMGSAALGLAYAASGRFDVFVHQFLFPWDVAAGILLVREGGGTVMDRDGAAVSLYSEGVVAGAPAPVREWLKKAAGKPWRE